MVLEQLIIQKTVQAIRHNRYGLKLLFEKLITRWLTPNNTQFICSLFNDVFK
jgi:hypothetical protein